MLEFLRWSLCLMVAVVLMDAIAVVVAMAALCLRGCGATACANKNPQRSKQTAPWRRTKDQTTTHRGHLIAAPGSHVIVAVLRAPHGEAPSLETAGAVNVKRQRLVVHHVRREVCLVPHQELARPWGEKLPKSATNAGEARNNPSIDRWAIMRARAYGLKSGLMDKCPAAAASLPHSTPKVTTVSANATLARGYVSILLCMPPAANASRQARHKRWRIFPPSEID